MIKDEALSTIQVPKEHYDFLDYITPERWMSYRHQIELVIKSGLKKVLVIGIGDNIVPGILRTQGIEVETCDIDQNLKPDHLQSLTELDFNGKKFDIIICCQVLEHLPFKEIENALSRLKQATQSILIISLPEKAFRLSFMIKLPKMNNFYLNIRIPLLFMKHTFEGQHHWELGTRENYKKKFKEIAKKYFNLDQCYVLESNPYHHFFIFSILKS